ncbi:hypothetical protein ACJX0J_037495, partial [Zea mays]
MCLILWDLMYTFREGTLDPSNKKSIGARYNQSCIHDKEKEAEVAVIEGALIQEKDIVEEFPLTETGYDLKDLNMGHSKVVVIVGTTMKNKGKGKGLQGAKGLEGTRTTEHRNGHLQKGSQEKEGMLNTLWNVVKEVGASKIFDRHMK